MYRKGNRLVAFFMKCPQNAHKIPQPRPFQAVVFIVHLMDYHDIRQETHYSDKEDAMRSVNYSDDYFFNSCHSYNRAKERAGLSRKRAERLMGLARQRGMGYEECKWNIDRKYLRNRYGEGSKAVAYNGFCFIFDTESLECITMYPLPKHFGKKKTFYEQTNCLSYTLKEAY